MMIDIGNLSKLMFIFPTYKSFKQFIKFYEGQTIQVPTIKELKQTLKLLNLFQKVYIDGKDFDKYYTKFGLNNFGLSKDYCNQQLEKFYNYIQKNDMVTLAQIRKIQKNKNKINNKGVK